MEIPPLSIDVTDAELVAAGFQHNQATGNWYHEDLKDLLRHSLGCGRNAAIFCLLSSIEGRSMTEAYTEWTGATSSGGGDSSWI
jgi:hypothetical protein